MGFERYCWRILICRWRHSNSSITVKCLFISIGSPATFVSIPVFGFHPQCLLPSSQDFHGLWGPVVPISMSCLVLWLENDRCWMCCSEDRPGLCSVNCSKGKGRLIRWQWSLISRLTAGHLHRGYKTTHMGPVLCVVCMFTRQLSPAPNYTVQETWLRFLCTRSQSA